jgi:hypothetical protein
VLEEAHEEVLEEALEKVLEEALEEVPDKALSAFEHMSLVLKLGVVLEKGHMDLRAGVQTGRAKLVVEEELEVVMMAGEVQKVVSPELERICLVVEHLMVQRCTVMVLVGLVVALYVEPLVVTMLMVGEHKRSMQTTLVGLATGMMGKDRQFLGTWHAEEVQLLSVEEGREELLAAQHRMEEPRAVERGLDDVPSLIADL